MKDITEGFVDFLQEYGVIGLAIAVVIGNATKDLVNAVVDDVLMPLVSLLLPVGSWENYTVSVGRADLLVGHLIGALLDFTIIALVIYAFVKLVLKKEAIEKV